MTQTSAATQRQDFPESTYTPVVSSSGMSYRPILELGEGGMAKIYLASAKGPGGFNKLVVLKSMHESDLEDEAIRQMFVEEARLSARFNHPNLVQVQEVSVQTDPPFLVMEYLEGKPLSALRATERLTLGMRLSLISEVLTGLEHAHGLCDFDGTPLGIVHRDVSPHNVFVTYDGSVKVLDFGIAKVVTNSMRTEAGEVKGKLAYMAPEQMLGAGVDRRADVFSVGSMLWEAAIGKRMWDGMTEPQLMHRLAVGEIPRPSEQGPIDPELEEIIVKATAPDPEQRYPTALALQQDLDAYRARAAEHSSIREIGTLLADSYQTERRRNAELVSAALQNSLPPPPLEELVLEEIAPPPSRSRWLLPAALLLLAGGGLLASRFLKAAPEPTPSALPSTAVIQATTSPRVEATNAEVATTVSAPDINDEAAATPSASAASGKSSGKPARLVPRPAAIAPGPAATPVAPAAAPAGAEGCSPPYYFVHGIKTYKPECL